MDEHLYDDIVKKIRKISMEVPGVLDTEKCYVRKSGLSYHVDLHIIVDAHITVKEGHEIAHQVQGILKDHLPQLGHVLIHVEPFAR
jgi:divalent metal cation (Fe/Co/Zn/Cd) transporter